MFKNILGAIGTRLDFRARTTFGASTGLLRRALGGLDLINKELANRVVEFVVSGANPAVLAELRAARPRTDILLGEPGRLRWSFDDGSEPDADRNAGADSLAYRDSLYGLVQFEASETPILVRLGCVLEAASQPISHTGVPMPGWLQFLLNDVLHATIRDGVTPQATRPYWNINLLAAIIKHEELPPELPLLFIFERSGADTYCADRLCRHLLESGNLNDYMLAHPEEVASAADGLSAAGRVALANRIGGSKNLLAAYQSLIVKLAVSDSKTVRAAAATHLHAMEKGQCVAQLQELLSSGQIAERGNAADLLARTMGQDAVRILQQALSSEAGKLVQQGIRNALSRLNAAGDAGALELPEPPPLPPLPQEVLGDDTFDLLLANRNELLEQLRKSAEDEAEFNLSSKYQFHYRRDHYEEYRKVTEKQLRLALLALNGDRSKDALAALSDGRVSQTLAFSGRLESRPDFGLLQLLRWTVSSGNSAWAVWYGPHFQAWLRKQDRENVDLRQLNDLAIECGADKDAVALVCLQRHWDAIPAPQRALPAHRVWPLFAAHPELIDEGLGLAANKGRQPGSEFDLGATLSVLATFPLIPARWLPRVMEFALGEGKTHRAVAQKVLSTLPDIGKRVCEALEASKLELRIEAARWLEQLDYRAGIPALYAALEKETRETVSATLITTLERMGEDMSAFLAPAKLLAQARKGLKGKAPAGLAWLNLDHLPACHWQDGTPVEPDIIRWWVILACKLKEPGGNALLERYLGVLGAPGRAALGSYLLHQFIAHDTANPGLEEGIAWANANAARQYQQNQNFAKNHPAYYAEVGKLTQEQVFDQLKRGKMAEYVGSAIGEKGILGLVSGMAGHELVSALQLYMRNHYQRRAQVEALLEAACVSDDPAVIQFTLGIARRYRTASVQEKAKMLVQRIAERNGWTQDQLADRTIPTGGLDEQGRMVLQYGSRTFTVMLDAAMKPVLKNEDGKAVSALPAPRQDDPDDAIKEAKQQFSTCKKELKQVVDMQTARLYEAMCAGRMWPEAEWREYLQQHPIVGRLAQRLIWIASSADGDAAHQFRPTEDGSLIDTDDNEVALGEAMTISLAHASLMSSERIAAWLAHFKDYKLTALFPQLTRQAPSMTGKNADNTIDDRLGWISDTFTLRGAFNKLGYQRGHAEDGGVFFEYKKDFGAAGIGVSMAFSGSALPEENVPAALKTLCFYSLDADRYSHSVLPLDKVPTILLAEAYGDYHAVAAACAGFDPQWENKMPW